MAHAYSSYSQDFEELYDHHYEQAAKAGDSPGRQRLRLTYGRLRLAAQEISYLVGRLDIGQAPKRSAFEDDPKLPPRLPVDRVPFIGAVNKRLRKLEVGSLHPSSTRQLPIANLKMLERLFILGAIDDDQLKARRVGALGLVVSLSLQSREARALAQDTSPLEMVEIIRRQIKEYDTRYRVHPSRRLH